MINEIECFTCYFPVDHDKWDMILLYDFLNFHVYFKIKVCGNLCYTRGGGGGGPSWHKSGSGLNKLNSIFDFVSCGNYLVNEGYVQSDLLSAIGWSAGCLLVGAAVNMHPQLFRAAILKVSII